MADACELESAFEVAGITSSDGWPVPDLNGWLEGLLPSGVLVGKIGLGVNAQQIWKSRGEL